VFCCSLQRRVLLALIGIPSDHNSYWHGAAMHTSQHKALELRIRQVGPWSLNAYALICPQTRESLLIDPGDDPAALTEMLAGTRPRSILVTHGHPDHIGALDVMRGKLDVPVLSHRGTAMGQLWRTVGLPMAINWPLGAVR
jgi:glyoxylase-like metal-dependent hydrolase (beta-lactamase superfamily II)